MNLKIDFKALREQSHVAAHFDTRDFPKRVFNAGLAGTFLAYLGATWIGLGLFAGIVASESGAKWLRRALPKKNCEVSAGLAVLVNARIVLTATLFAIISLALMFQDSLVGLLAGQLFLTGSIMQSHATHAMFYAVRSINFSVFAFAMVVFFSTVMTNEYPPPTRAEGLFLFVFLFAWMSTIFINILRGTHTRKLYDDAVRTAEDRAAELAHVARHDQLTSLLNRRGFDELGTDPAAFGVHAALLLIDLDRFKPINDDFGHAAGDAVLSAIGARIAETNEEGHAARIGGDEFAILISDASDREKIDDLVATLSERLAQPIPFEGWVLTVGASIGFAYRESAHESFDALCSRADQAMYAVKATRKRRREDLAS